MADHHDEVSPKRRRLLDELDTLNGHLVELDMPVLLSMVEADRRPTRELRFWVSASRSHYLQIRQQLKGIL